MNAPRPHTLNPSRRDRLAWVLLAGAVAVYLFSRLNHIEEFPIYFFCDEAVHSVRFRQLVENGWHAVDAPHELLPAYFPNGGMLNLSLSVYLQGLASLMGGQTVATVRATSVVASLTGALALAFTLRGVFALREWWSVIVFLAVIPCWFLHSRTGFETVLMVSSYCWFFYFYLRYREDDPRWIFPAMAAGAATFYAYAPGQGIMLVTGALLAACDFRYHRAHHREVLAGVGLGLLLFTPYVRFRWDHPEMVSGHLKILSSYWTEAMPLGEKFRTFGRNYLVGLSPHYWFEVGADRAVRHVVPNRAHIPALLTPFALVGLFLCIRNWWSAPHRLILIAVVASPFSSALVAPGITRMLTFVVPFALAASLGFDWLVGRVRSTGIQRGLRIASFGLLATSTVGLLQGALIEGPTFPKNYGLYGIQWGSKKIFRDLLPRYLKSDPAANIFISHSSFNGPDEFPRFFGWMNERRVLFSVLDDYAAGNLLPETKDLVLLSVEEYDAIPRHPEIDRFLVRERVDWPDGQPGFYLGHLSLNPGFVEKVRRDPRRQPRPIWERFVVEGTPFSASASGITQDGMGTLFSEEDGGIVSQEGAAINVEIVFDAGTTWDQIQVKADPGQLISIWVTQAKAPPFTVVGSMGKTTLTTSLSSFPVDSIRIELAARPGIGRINRIRLIPQAR